MIAIITQWRIAWKYRNNNTQHKVQERPPNADIVKKKIQFIYDNKEFIDLNNQTFLKEKMAEHLSQSITQIENWLYIRFQALQSNIIRNNQTITWMKYTQEQHSTKGTNTKETKENEQL
jgi:hypothetical protein